MKLTTEKLKKLIREELENVNKGMTESIPDGAIPNPTFDEPQIRVVTTSGKLHHVHFMGFGPNKRAEVHLPSQRLSRKAAEKLMSMKGQGMTISDAPGLAQYLSTFTKNIGEEEIASAKVV
jgi:hypothetical protein